MARNKAGTQLWGPPGASIWSAPTVDDEKTMIYVGTGDNFSEPATDSSDAILAFDMATGRIVWSKQLTQGDAYTVGCRMTDKQGCPDSVRKVNHYHMQQFAYFLDKMHSTPDGDGGSLLDNTIVLYGCGISDSNDHLQINLPIIVVGGGTGELKGGRHLRVAENTPLANLHLTVLDKIGGRMETLGDSRQ